MARRNGVVLCTLCCVVINVYSQLTRPFTQVTIPQCDDEHIEACRMDCPRQYHDPERYLCPCYSKMSACLVQLGCSLAQKIKVMAFCTRKGYCKEGYCQYRRGDLTPRFDTRFEVFDLTSVKAPSTPCIDGCCPGNSSCTEDTTMLSVRLPGRRYRKEESRLPPREGDPRLGVNQDYNRMPYSIPLANIP
uniref:Uncharacterized protein AlNc14C11G1316 n=1 Tax=Albugo laibachii Nc14 TaxID=890382 RepID=F0W2T6_9STRA|nr:conserved hypothetical protein [Albugo laibachii Nc14]|eukprot:CCA15372.1 conserved hypothetical protein [Albugo laibachii Nc14]